MRVAVLVTLLLLTPVASAVWLQDGGDARGTRRATGAAPEWGDVLLRLRVPELATIRQSPPLIVGGALFVAADALTIIGAPERQFVLVRIDLQDGSVAILDAVTLQSAGTIAAQNPAMASDGEDLFLVALGHVVVFDTSTSSWGRPFPLSPAMAAPTGGEPNQCCTSYEAAFSDGRLFVAAAPRPILTGGGIVRLFVVDPYNATVQGPWIEVAEADQASPEDLSSLPWLAATSHSANLRGIAVEGTRAFVAVTVPVDANDAPSSPAQEGPFSHLWSIDVATGQQWSRVSPWTTGLDGEIAPPILLPDAVVVRSGDLTAYDKATGAVRANNVALLSDLDTGAAMALGGTMLYAPIGDSMIALDAELRPAWPEPAVFEGLSFQQGGTVAFDDAVVALAGVGVNAASELLAVDARTGALRWRLDLGARSYLAAADGLVAAVDDRGFVTLIGRAAWSLRPTFAATTAYPQPGEPVEIDLSATPPSPLGPPTAFRVDWGDGTLDEWSPEPRRAHVYATAGDANARVFARNEANQTASAPLVFHVGQHDPAVNILNSPLSDEYQNTTFFLLGLVVTALIGAFSIARAGRKRRRFARELRELEEEHARLANDARACDAMLQRRRATARALFLRGAVEEAHATFLVARVDELRRSSRLDAVDHKLKFLPHGMVLHLHRLLDDARIDSFERAHFLAALEAESSITRDQKAHVRAVIDEWFARDAAPDPYAEPARP